MDKKIKKLIRISKEVIADCALENGAIVAANTDQTYYPREAANYRWVWPRDACFTCLAAQILNLPIQEPFFEWLYQKPQDFKKQKILYANYSTNGRIGSMGRIFEPDQAGTVLWYIHSYYQKDFKKALKFKNLIERLANGLSLHWNKTFFSIHTVDLWEEGQRHTTTSMQNNFTYSLAACARGLLCAYEIIANSFWKETALQMLKEIEEAYNEKDKYFYRNCGKVSDKNVDASLLGLVWPFSIYEPSDQRIVNTVQKIEEKLVVGGGVHRFEYDYFDSEGSAWEGGGAWPALNFWMCIYWCLRKNKRRAFSYYQWVIDKLDSYHGFIPEQIFDDERRGIYPLAWSHAMFIIASKFLGYL